MTGTTAAPTGTLANPSSSTTGDSSTKDKAASVAADAKEKVVETTSKVRTQALDMADQRKGKLVEPARSVVDQTKRFVRELDESDTPIPTGMLETAVREMEEVAEYVESTPVEEMLDDLSVRVRKAPFTFLGVAFAAGFLPSRLLKAEPVETPQLPSSTGGTYSGSL